MTNILKSDCRECEKETNHEIKFSLEKEFREDYCCNFLYQIIECLGCNTVGFREVYEDIDSLYPDQLTFEWILPQEITTYPKKLNKDKKILLGGIFVPQIVLNIYHEVLKTIKEEAYTLTGLGLRAIVECICNEQKITGDNLEIRIDKLYSKGYISKKYSEILHGIRFMGNDAAHNIKAPEINSINVALKIVENLIYTVYIIEEEAKQNLETVISDFSLFEELLNKSLANTNSGDEYPIAYYLGKDKRRVNSTISTLERELVTKINNSTYSKLKLGKLDKFNDSKEKLQHFIVL